MPEIIQICQQSNTIYSTESHENTLNTIEKYKTDSIVMRGADPSFTIIADCTRISKERIVRETGDIFLYSFKKT